MRRIAIEFLSIRVLPENDPEGSTHVARNFNMREYIF
jgi:hypothetical protein